MNHFTRFVYIGLILATGMAAVAQDLEQPKAGKSGQKRLSATKSGEDPRALNLADIQKQVPAGVTFIPDIAYREGDGAYWRLDLAMPEKPGDKPRPALVIVHGGGWSTGDKRLNWCVQPLFDYAARGYVCISINYRLTSEGGFPANIEDCKCAVRWLRAHAQEYSVDPDRVGAFGSSAGAHLACMLGLASNDAGLEGDGPYQDQSSQVNAVCAVATPTDFSNWGRGRFASEVMAKKCSPVAYARAGSPPILLLQGTEDKTVPMSQPELLVEALRKAGAKDAKLIKLEGAGHGAVMSRSKEIGPLMAEFFDRTIGSQSQSPKQPNHQ